jgi:2-iminobutanoate/2-iminopropanoate deaminase
LLSSYNIEHKMTIEHLTGPDVPGSFLPFSPAVRVGNLLFVSGQASVDRTGHLVPGTFEEEMRRSLDNVRAVLVAAGSDLKQVIRTCNYVRDSIDLEAYNRIYAEYFVAPHPARTTITNCLHEHLRYEVDCIALVES